MVYLNISFNFPLITCKLYEIKTSYKYTFMMKTNTLKHRFLKKVMFPGLPMSLLEKPENSKKKYENCFGVV